jgi:hypothetical protein
MSTDRIPTDEERGIPTYKERVARAFLGAISTNDSALPQEQIRAVQIICADWEFAEAVRDYLNTIFPLHLQKQVSSETPRI